MSDLSTLPMPLLSEPPPVPTPPPAASEAFAWPTPALPCYPAPAPAAQPEACEVEGTNGKTMLGRLMRFEPAERWVQLRVAPSRATITLRFDQFRRLRLLHPLAPLASDGADAVAERPVLPYELRLHGGERLEGLTIGHLDDDAGLFLFEPIDLAGNVRRMFYPREAYETATVGMKLGDAPVPERGAMQRPIAGSQHEPQRRREHRLGELLVARELVDADELAAALERQASMPMVRIGEALVALGLVTPAQLDEALAQQKTDRGVALGELLVRKGYLSREDLQLALARKMGYPLVDVLQFPVEAAALALVPVAVATRLGALPLILRAGRIVVALEDPSDTKLLSELEFAARCKPMPVLARPGLLDSAIARAYERIGSVEFSGHGHGAPGLGPEFEAENAGALLATLEQQQDTADPRAADADENLIEQSDNSLVRLLNTMILEAQAQGVSDIHIETQPGREKVRIRFRKDGQLRPYLELPHTYRNALIARIKIMCDLDISERRKPQDGKITFGRFVHGQKLELRVATIPTHSGLEDAVLRLLASARPLPLDRLGLAPATLARLEEIALRPYGMMLCVGPTGSGKTTTLHSLLGHINTPDRKIWTAEDPIEITQAGLRQVQVNPKIDWTFERALRAFLRADPDVVMVGEIRDRETAQVAIEASLTGHLVLSTLHTNSAPETVTRLLDMGMDPFNFADALLGVLAQRLVRRLCTECRSPHEATRDEIDEVLHDYRRAAGTAAGLPGDDELQAGWLERYGKDGRLTLYRAVGCPKCDRTGYRGRAGIHELMTVSRKLRQMIQSGARAEELQQQALQEGMHTLRQDGLEKVWAGITTLDEVRAVSN